MKKFFKAVVKFQQEEINEKTGKEKLKKWSERYLLVAEDSTKANELLVTKLTESTPKTMEWAITSIKEENIVEIYK